MSVNPAKTAAWKELQKHRQDIENVTMRDLFAKDAGRFKRYSVLISGLLFDYSKNRITDETLVKLIALAKECNVEGQRAKMFAGEKINVTEKRSVLHTACRAPKGNPVMVDGEDAAPFIHRTLDKMYKFAENIRSGAWAGHTGRPLRHIVNIGIGGSDLGPYMATQALKKYQQSDIAMHYVSNVDPSDLSEKLQFLDPEQTLFIVASKTFTTQETMANAAAAKAWLVGKLGADCVAKHFCALSTNESAVRAFGIAPENMFPFREWVGGRYSMWSAIGLSICIAIGADNFKSMLSGAYAADEHFKNAPMDHNIPVLMALLGIWYRNFWDCPSYAVLPYDQYLHRFPAFLQQMDMESNGKDVDREGKHITDYKTGPVLFGEPGTNGQHAFYQLIHQGSDVIPCDFIGCKQSQNPIRNQHELLLNNMLAQAQALMQGRTLAEADGNPARVFSGNRPSNIFMLDKLDPYSLGLLVALYEHKVFVQGAIWNINSYDQYGVELGKELANKLEKSDDSGLDSSTAALMAYRKS